jgi:hypothetical protein
MMTGINFPSKAQTDETMNLLDPKIGRKISPLIHGITKERRDFILEIAKSATDWKEFEARLNSGGFPIETEEKI